MIDAATKTAHERLREAGWTVELRSDKNSRNDFARKQFFAYTNSNGDITYDLEQALARLDSKSKTTRSCVPPPTRVPR